MVGVLALAACTGGDSVGEGRDGDGAAPTTQRLAPSQISASTIARPDTPPSCDPDELAWWTAQATPAGTTSTAVVRVRNDGDSWCEVDIAGSPALAADAEPNVWLEPGEWGDLIVGSVADRCSPSVFDTVEVVVSHTVVDVPSIVVATCAPTILAFYVADPPAGSCTELESTVVGAVLLVRNAGSVPCELGEVVGVVSPGDAAAGAPTSDVAVTALAGGDVVAIGTVPVGGECTATPTAVTFDVAGEVEVAGAPSCPVEGPARPWFQSVSPGSVIDVLAGLDPFG